MKCDRRPGPAVSRPSRSGAGGCHGKKSGMEKACRPGTLPAMSGEGSGLGAKNGATTVADNHLLQENEA